MLTSHPATRKDLKPTYRGKEKKGAKALDKKSVKRFSIMMRRYETIAFHEFLC